MNSLVIIIKFVEGVGGKEQQFRGKHARLREHVWSALNEHQSKFKKSFRKSSVCKGKNKLQKSYLKF